MKEQIIERIPITQIHIANPRPRSRGRWQMIVANIREVGLKKPITVVRRSEPNADGEQFDLVCGQGRIEAFLALGETTIPAIIAGNTCEAFSVGAIGSPCFTFSWTSETTRPITILPAVSLTIVSA